MWLLGIMVVVVILDWIFVLMNTTTMIPLQVRLTCMLKLFNLRNFFQWKKMYQ